MYEWTNLRMTWTFIAAQRSLQDNVPLQRSQQKVTATARIVANNALLQTCTAEATIKRIYLITWSRIEDAMNGFSLSGTGTQTHLFVICEALCKNAHRWYKSFLPFDRNTTEHLIPGRATAHTCCPSTAARRNEYISDMCFHCYHRPELSSQSFYQIARTDNNEFGHKAWWHQVEHVHGIKWITTQASGARF